MLALAMSVLAIVLVLVFLVALGPWLVNSIHARSKTPQQQALEHTPGLGPKGMASALGARKLPVCGIRDPGTVAGKRLDSMRPCTKFSSLSR